MKKKNDIKKTELIADTDVMNINDTCPVMGGAVDKKLYIEKNNRKVYVCCEYCLKTVSKDFDKYYQKAYKPIESGKKEKTIYACPMHPEIISDKPGKCVKCGMKLKLKN
ncbi:hypothetical protein KA977_00550 [Candidatus Dependentiae bacterium]|nr:hypothetical protein [Candidatus Dependentiae bacterium]